MDLHHNDQRHKSRSLYARSNPIQLCLQVNLPFPSPCNLHLLASMFKVVDTYPGLSNIDKCVSSRVSYYDSPKTATQALARTRKSLRVPPTSKSGAADDLVIDGKLASTIVDDHDPDAAASIGKGIVELLPERALVDDGQGLDDVSGLGHGNDATLVNVENAVLLEDGTEHGLDVDRGRRVAHEAGLFLKLLGEEIHTEVAMLASLSRSGDADNLARTALEHDKIADADVVAGDRHGAGGNTAGAFDETNAITRRLLAVAVTLDNNLLTVVAAAMDRMHDAVGGTLYAAAEGVVAAFIIVVAHSGFLLVVDLFLGFYVDVFLRCSTFVFDVVGSSLATWSFGAAAVLAFGDVDLGLAAGPALTLDVDVDFGAASWFSVATNDIRTQSFVVG